MGVVAVTAREGKTMPEFAHVSLEAAISKGAPPPGNLAAPIFGHGSLEVEMYRPEGSDLQKPHERDEVYVVARGTGTFFDGTKRQAVLPGAFIFVGAASGHLIGDSSAGFAVCVRF